MRILFTICARAGSKGFKNKNLKELNTIPLVYYTIAVISMYIENHPDDDIIVALNTDSEELRRIVRNQSLVERVVVVERKESLAGDRIAKVDVIRDTYLTVNSPPPELLLDMGTAVQKCGFDAIVDLDITSPLRSCKDVENAIIEFCSNPEYDLVFSVVEGRRSPYFNMVEMKGDGFYHKICSSNYVARQETPGSYELNASIYVYNPFFLERETTKTILDYKCGISIMKDYLVLDIDSEEDFVMMEILHKHYCETDGHIRQVFELAKRCKYAP